MTIDQKTSRDKKISTVSYYRFFFFCATNHTLHGNHFHHLDNACALPTEQVQAAKLDEGNTSKPVEVRI